MHGQVSRIVETLADPDRIIGSATDSDVELFYKLYRSIAVTTKFLDCGLKEKDGSPQRSQRTQNLIFEAFDSLGNGSNEIVVS
jgi:hypothetical protein